MDFLDSSSQFVSDALRNLTQGSEPLRKVTLLNDPPYGYLKTWDIERDYDFHKWRKFLGKHWDISLYISVAYVTLIFLGQRWMKNRPAFKLETEGIVYNLAMGIFCFTGFYRALPETMEVLLGPDGIHKSLCIFENHTKTAAFWGLCNVLSRFIELFGTAFIVLRKRPLLFLHYYHHVTVLIYCWYLYETYEISLRVFGMFNSLVHALVYFYFGLKGLGVKFSRKLSMALTLIQLSEMFIGIAVNIYNLNAKNAGIECHRNYESIYCAFTMYATYFILFAKLFKDAYLTKKPRKKVE